MALTEAETAKCAEWCKSPAHKWQVLNRGQWKYQFHPKTLVRFVEEAKMDEGMVRLLLEYLGSDDCKATLELYGQGIDSEWTPIRAWYEISNRGVGSVHGVRLYHALQSGTDTPADGPYLVEDGCAYKVSWTYYWNQAAVAEIPASESGTSYRISGLTRDQETGLFTYAIEKRERVQQDIPEYLTATDVFQDVKEEVHLGVRGELDAGGKAASVGNGKKTTRKVSKNADCTHDVHNTTTQDKSVKEAVVEYAKTLHGVQKSVTDRNQPEALGDEGMVVGERRSTRKTDSGLHDNTVTKTAEEGAGETAKSESRTIFEDAQSKRKNVAAGGVLPEMGAEEAGGGKTHSVDVRLNENGSADITTSSRKEKPVALASETISVTLEGVVKTVRNRNQTNKAPAPSEIGESVENEKTPGGLWNQTIRSRIKGALVRLAESCAATIFAHRHTKSHVQSEDPGFSHAQSAGGGKTHTASVSRTSGGVYRVDESETLELPVANASRTARMTLNGLSVRVVNRNQSEPLPDPEKVGESVTNSKTDGGLYNTEKAVEGARGAGITHEDCVRDNFTHHHTIVSNDKEPQEAETVFAIGKIVHKSASLTGNGTANNATDTTTAVPSMHRYHYTDSSGATHYVVKYRNQSREYDTFPGTAHHVSLSDEINRFGLHDGTLAYIIGGITDWEVSAANLKFIKYGPREYAYETDYRGKRNVRHHRKYTLQLVWKYGDAYTDYVADALKANPARNNSGVAAAKLLGKWSDQYGNLCCECVFVNILDCGNWEKCTSNCEHGAFDGGGVRDTIQIMLGGHK